MKFVPGQVHVLGLASGVQSVQHPFYAGAVLRSHALVAAFGEKELQTLVLES